MPQTVAACRIEGKSSGALVFDDERAERLAVRGLPCAVPALVNALVGAIQNRLATSHVPVVIRHNEASFGATVILEHARDGRIDTINPCCSKDIDKGVLGHGGNGGQVPIHALERQCLGKAASDAPVDLLGAQLVEVSVKENRNV